MADETRRIITFAQADQIALAPVRWLIDGWLVEDTLAGLVGPSGCCKSFVGIDWACRVATGAPWFGRNVRQGAVFYLAGEGRSGLRKRIAGWEHINGVSITGAPLFIADSLPSLCDELNVAAVLAEIEQVAEAIFYRNGCEPSLVVVDTLARAMAGGDENSAADMGRLVRGLDWIRERWSCCVLTIHHTGHGENTQERARGSSAYRAALDSEFIVKADLQAVTLRGSKAKDWDAPSALTLAKHVVSIALPGMPTAETTLALRDGAGMMRELDKREEVIELAKMNLSQREIADRTNISKSTVSRWAKGLGSRSKTGNRPETRTTGSAPPPHSKECGAAGQRLPRGANGVGQGGASGASP